MNKCLSWSLLLQVSKSYKSIAIDRSQIRLRTAYDIFHVFILSAAVVLYTPSTLLSVYLYGFVNTTQ